MSKNKVKIERKEGDVWRSVKVKAGVSRNDNFYAKYHREVNGELKEIVLVWKDEREGTPVVEKVAGKWVQVGRITKFHEIFLGEGQSYEEYAQSPEGLEVSRKMLESIRESRFPKMREQPVKKFEYPDLLNGGDSQ